MNEKRPMEFDPEEFRRQNKDVRWLCRALRGAVGAPPQTGAPGDSIDWLNGVLRQTEFFDRVLAAKRSIQLTGEARKLAEDTAEVRKRTFAELGEDEQYAVKKLNRLVMELAFPGETPKAAYELAALVRTKKGENLLREHPDIESFNREMREHGGDIEWGFLVRMDEGKILARHFARRGRRERTGLIDTDPVSSHLTPEGLTPPQAALREAAIRHFKSNKAKAYISEQIRHVNINKQVGEIIRSLFDNDGRPPANAPLEDIRAEREETEANIRWLETICSELRNNLSTLKEIEESALELLREDTGRR